MFKIVIQDEDVGAKALGCLRIYLQKYSNAKARKWGFEAITIRECQGKNKQKRADKKSLQINIQLREIIHTDWILWQ